MPTLIPIDAAYEALDKAVQAFPALESSTACSILEARGRYLNQAVTCRYSSPPFTQSAMDGIAFGHEAGRMTYQLVGTVQAGDVPNQVKPEAGQCVRIMTGAPVPSTADTVVMVEHIKVTGDQVQLEKEPVKGQNIRYEGENLKAGADLYPVGTKITGGVLAGLLSQGVRSVLPKRRLRIGVAATGNEVIDHRLPLGAGQIYNSNGPMMATMLEDPNIEVSYLGSISDVHEETVRCLEHNSDLDVLVLSGGVSMGNFDLVPGAAQEAGFEEVFHKIQMKPGKPVWFGVHRKKNTLLFGLPGNPVSSLVGTMLYVKPVLEGIFRGQFKRPAFARAKVSFDVTNRGKFPLFKGVMLSQGADGLMAEPLQTAGSGDILKFSRLESLCLLPADRQFKSGDDIEVLLPFP